MSSQRWVPVLVGVGDVVNRLINTDVALEPMQLMLAAIEKAITDAQSKSTDEFRNAIDSIDVVACWTWPYPDLPGLLAQKLGVKPRHTFSPSYHGGNQPVLLFDEAARRISTGESQVAVVCGGEALASLGAFAKAGRLPPPGWTDIHKKVDAVFSPTARELATGLGAPHSIGAPIHVYPLFENGLRAHNGQSIEDNNNESAELYANFAQVAEHQQFAWNYRKPALSKEVIGTVSSKNRMICFPYPMLMNAFNNVNLAAACLLTSTEYATKMGITEDRWVYPLGGAGTRDSYDFWERPNFHSSPSISRSLDACMQVSKVTTDQVDIFDFYSCFPIVPKVACRHLGLSTTQSSKPITVLGGLTSFGGAGNNYSMHALTEMTRKIRAGGAKTGLVLANGGVMTYQHAACLSSRPRSDEYPKKNPLPEVLDDVKVPEVDVKPEGEATIETYTVEFKRDGTPLRGHIVGRLTHNNHRFLANHGDDWTLHQLCSTSGEPIGRMGIVSKDDKVAERNLFSLIRDAKL